MTGDGKWRVLGASHPPRSMSSGPHRLPLPLPFQCRPRSTRLRRAGPRGKLPAGDSGPGDGGLTEAPFSPRRVRRSQPTRPTLLPSGGADLRPRPHPLLFWAPGEGAGRQPGLSFHGSAHPGQIIIYIFFFFAKLACPGREGRDMASTGPSINLLSASPSL